MREIKSRAKDMGGHWVYGDLRHKRTSLGDVMMCCGIYICFDSILTTNHNIS